MLYGISVSHGNIVTPYGGTKHFHEFPLGTHFNVILRFDQMYIYAHFSTLAWPYLLQCASKEGKTEIINTKQYHLYRSKYFDIENMDLMKTIQYLENWYPNQAACARIIGFDVSLRFVGLYHIVPNYYT